MQKTKIAGAMAALTLCANANLAFAQLEEVVVTAQKRLQSANDIGMSISALNSDALTELRVLDTSDLAIAVPGLTFADVGSGTPIYTLRGVGFNESSLQAQATVGIYNDEVATPFPIMTNGLIMDLERVEVMKGPQGTLFGRNSTGGAINYIANKPSDEFEAGVTVGYGRFETTDAEAYINGALTDSVRARLAVKTIQSSEGWQESVSRNDELGEQDRISARLLLAADFGDSVDVLLNLNWWRDKSDSLAPQLVEANFQNPANQRVIDAMAPYYVPDTRDDNDRADWTLGIDPSKDMENRNASLTLNWQINDDVKLTSLTSYSDFDDKSQFNRDGWGGAPISDPEIAALIPVNSTPALGGTWEAPASGYLNNSSYGSDSSIDAFSQELRLTGAAERFTWILGAYYSDDTVDADRPTNNAMSTNTNLLAEVPGLGTLGLQGAAYTSKQDGDAWAVFGHTEIDISEQWMLTLGARYTEDNKDFKGCARDRFGDLAFLFDVNPGECITEFPDGERKEYKDSLDEDSVSGKVAINYSLNDDTLLYLSYSRGYKSGSFPTIAATQSFQMEPVEQEKLDAYEGGFKLRLGDGKAQLNGAVFYYDYTDKQLLAKVDDPQFGSLFRLTNIPDSEIYGAEIELQWQPTEGLFMGVAGSYLDTEINDFFGFTQDSTEPFDLSGSKMPLTPEYQASANASYEWSVWQNMTAFVGGDLSYSDSFQTDYASGQAPLRPVYEIDSYTLLGLRAGLRAADGSWNVMAWGRNVTDEFYASNVYKSVDGIIRTNGMPATYGVSFSYNWL